MSADATKVFVSYSRADASLVRPVVKLLRSNKTLVVQDAALAQSQLVVVFWCNHASRSSEVSKEWRAAIEQKKDLLPLLLDATPLPPELGELRWIDFKDLVGPTHRALGLQRVLHALGVVAMLSLAAGLVWYFWEASTDLVHKLALLGGGLVVAGGLVGVWAMLWRGGLALQRSATGARSAEKRIASEVEAEIVRRTT